METRNPYRKEHGARPQRRAAKWGKAIAFLVIAGGLVYLFAATAAGKWLSDNVFKPGLNALSCAGSSTETTAPSEEATAAEGKSEQIKQQGFIYYCIQTGAFSHEENANAEAQSVKLKGGAGYIFYDGMYRVLIAFYGSSDDAKTVREQLKTEQGMDTMIYQMKADDLSFKITAKDDQIAALKDAFAAYFAAHEAAVAANSDSDTGGAITQATQTKLDDAAGALDKAKAALVQSWEGNHENKVYTAMIQLIDAVRAEIGSLALMESASDVQEKSAVKYSCLSIAGEYVKFIKEINGI
ncbi:MAG: SPOR domain-containing protein [Bacillota bacterium]|nr:SPOR domain-containing protein [Bacillota bacterium]